MRRLMPAVFVLNCALAAFSCAEAQEMDTYEVEGVASEVDAIGCLLVVQTTTPRGNYEAMRLKVPDSTKIYQGTEDVRLNDIDIGDSVTVTYYKDSEGNLKTTQITDNNIANNQM